MTQRINHMQIMDNWICRPNSHIIMVLLSLLSLTSLFFNLEKIIVFYHSSILVISPKWNIVTKVNFCSAWGWETNEGFLLSLPKGDHLPIFLILLNMHHITWADVINQYRYWWPDQAVSFLQDTIQTHLSISQSKALLVSWTPVPCFKWICTKGSLQRGQSRQ